MYERNLGHKNVLIKFQSTSEFKVNQRFTLYINKLVLIVSFVYNNFFSILDFWLSTSLS
jgi:hypothetical protein